MTPDHLNAGIGGVFPGEKVLERMSMTHSVKQTLLAQAGITLVNYVFTCVMLHLQTSRKNTVDLTQRDRDLHEDHVSKPLESSLSGKSNVVFSPPRV